MERRRVACDGCAKRKIKCDRVLPRCEWCRGQDIECTANRSHRSIKKIKIDHQRDQNSLQDGSSVDSDQSCHPSDKAYVSNSQALPLMGYNLNILRAFNGMPFFSQGGREWVQAHTGKEITLPHRRLSGMTYSSFHRDKKSIALPDRAIVHHYLTVFNSAVFRQLFLLLDAELFDTTVHMAYSHSSESLDTMNAKMCIFAFLGFTSSFSIYTREATNGEIYIFEAQRLLSELMHYPATLEGLQTVIFLILHYQSTFGDLSSIDALMSTASRFAYSLGGHISPGSLHDSPSRHDWHCRNLFWVCYNIDRKLCLRTGHPPCINDNCCDLTLSDEYIALLKSTMPSSPGSSEPIFLLDLRLSLIESKIFLELYAAPSLGKSDAELLRTIRTLDTAVESWNASALSDHPLEQKATPEQPDLHTAIFRMQYLYSVATIHQATTRCSAWIQDQGRTMEGVSSSLMISVDASRDLLRLLYILPTFMLEDGFWFSLFYFLSAAIILFCNVLNSPHSPETSDDILILEALARHIRQSSQRRASPQVQPNIDNAEQFAAELGRLARCAVQKAQMY